MRDLLIVAIVLPLALMALRRPWIGALLWAWLSLMNPHRFAFGFAYDAPLAAIAAAATVLGLAFTRDRRSPLKTPNGVLFLLFILWITVSWQAGMDPEGDYEQWKKVMKIFFMTLVTMALIIRREQIVALVWVVTLSLGILGAKGGLFTLLTGGDFRVWGPPGTFIEDNNEFALALVMTIPLLRFLQQQCERRWQRLALGAGMLLCAAAAIGSHSRGALLAIGAMGLTLWWRSRSRLTTGVIMVAVAVFLTSFMPEDWMTRMATIGTYDEDSSALGRINAWWTAFNVAKDRPLGIGFTLWRPEVFALYAPVPDDVHAAHSIYFLVLGNHGFIGLALFLAIFGVTWRQSMAIRRLAKAAPADWAWCDRLAAMCQVSLIGFAVGGAFLSLSYFDLPYYLMIFVSATLLWMRAEQAAAIAATGARGPAVDAAVTAPS
jgi:probable O-glycosylation ligase (exosortase A-associated)